MIKNLIAGMFICLCLGACEEPDLVSSDVIPGSDQPGIFSDTLEVEAFTTTDKELVSSYTTVPMFLGSINDQTIGSTEASFYIQMLIGTSAPSIPQNAVLKSMEISLAYEKIYGDENARHSAAIYELSEDLIKDSTYHTTDTFALKDAVNPIGTGSFIPLKENKTTTPRMRIRFNSAFAQSFFADVKDSASQYASNDLLLKRFKGLYIKSTADMNGAGDVKGSIASFYPTSSINTVTIYYSYTDSVVHHASYSFQLGSSSARSNRVVQTYNSGIINDSLQTPPSLYIQSLNGLRIKVKFPGVTALAGQGLLSINKAELVVKVKSGSDNIIKPHSGFFVYYDSLAGNYTTAIDYYELVDGIGDVIGGTLSENTYKINIAQQMQLIANGTVDNYIYLTAGGRGLNVQRTILEGAGSIKLNLTYTKNN